MSAASITVSAAALVVSIIVGLSSALRSQYDRMINVLDYISSDQVAQARHQLGLIIHSRRVLSVGHETDQRVADLFVILWAFQRVNAVRRSLPWIQRWLPLPSPHTLLRKSVEPWVQYWDKHIEKTAKDLGAETQGSHDGLCALAKDWGKRWRDSH